MSLHDDLTLTFKTATRGPATNWPVYGAIAGMLAMFGGMLATMWFLSSGPTMDARPWICLGISLAGNFLWRGMLPKAVAGARR
jgi:fucose 4-O-acetylase-like acetyltransferase